MKTAKEIRSLFLVKPVTQSVPNVLKEKVSTQIETAAKVGLTQTTVNFSRSEYLYEDLSDLRKFLLDRGYAVVMGQSSGFIGTNLLVDPKISLTIMW